MKNYQSLGALARAFERVVAELPETFAATAKAGAMAVEKDAKERIGHYQVGWPKLADSTVAQKRGMDIAFGGDGEDNPLLRTGAMRSSIESASTEMEFVVGSEDQTLAYQELGTSRIPPRPALGPALKSTAPFIAEVLGGAVEKTLSGDFT